MRAVKPPPRPAPTWAAASLTAAWAFRTAPRPVPGWPGSR